MEKRRLEPLGGPKAAQAAHLKDKFPTENLVSLAITMESRELTLRLVRQRIGASCLLGHYGYHNGNKEFGTEAY